MTLRMRCFLMFALLQLVINYSYGGANLHKEDVPNFILDVYNCWNSGPLNHNKASCLPVNTEKSTKNINSVSVIQGTGNQSTSEGVHSNSTSLPSSITFIFPATKQISAEEIVYVNMIIPNLLISENALNVIDQECSDQLLLHLYSKVTSNERVFTLLSSSTISREDLGESLHVVFNDITDQFIEWQKTEEEVEMRLTIGGADSCTRYLTPQDLGFHDNITAYIVLYREISDSDSNPTVTGLNQMMKEAMFREKRTSSPRREVNMAQYENQETCQLHNFTVNVSEYATYSRAIQRILYPLHIEMNFCAGSCDPNVNPLRSHVFNIAERENLTSVIPSPPCCVPGDAESLAFIYVLGDGNIYLYQLNDVNVLSCGCTKQ